MTRRREEADRGMVGVLSALLMFGILSMALGALQYRVAPEHLREGELRLTDITHQDVASLRRSLLSLAEQQRAGAGASAPVQLGGSMAWLLSEGRVVGTMWAEPDPAGGGFLRVTVQPPAGDFDLFPEAPFSACACSGGAQDFKLNPLPLARTGNTSLQEFRVRLTDIAYLAASPGASFKVYAMNATHPPPAGAATSLAWNAQTIWAGVFYPAPSNGNSALTLHARSSATSSSAWRELNTTVGAATMDLLDPGLDPRRSLRGALDARPGLFDLWFVNADRAHGDFLASGVAFQAQTPVGETPAPVLLDLPLGAGAVGVEMIGEHGASRAWLMQATGLFVSRDTGQAIVEPLPLRVQRNNVTGALEVELAWFNLTPVGAVASRGLTTAEASALGVREEGGQAANLTLRLPTPFPASTALALHEQLLDAGVQPGEYVLTQGPGWVELELLGPCGAGGVPVPGVPPLPGGAAPCSPHAPLPPPPPLPPPANQPVFLPPGPPSPPGTGTIRVCLAMVDPANATSPASPYAGASFRLPAVGAPPGYVAPWSMGDTTWSFPLTLTDDLLFSDGVKDAQCVVHGSLSIDPYFHGPLSVQGIPRTSFADRYNDQNIVAVSTLADFFPFSPELFTPDPSDDASRDTNADGHIVLNPSRPERTLVVRDSTPAEMGPGPGPAPPPAACPACLDVTFRVRLADVSLRIGGV